MVLVLRTVRALLELGPHVIALQEKGVTDHESLALLSGVSLRFGMPLWLPGRS